MTTAGANLNTELRQAASILCDGLLLRCSADGQQLLEAAEPLPQWVSDVPADASLPALLRLEDSAAWADFIAVAPLSVVQEAEFAYTAADESRRWLNVRCLAAADTSRLVFCYDSTRDKEKSQRLARAQAAEIEAGARLQTAVLVNGPEVHSDYIAYVCATIPSRLVDGDFLDAFRISDTAVEFVFGDVMGKGMEAATLATLVKYSLFRELASLLPRCSDVPAVSDVCAMLERSVSRQLLARRSIVTLSYVRYLEPAQAVEFVDCGQPPLIHYRSAQNTCLAVKGADMPLGFADQQDFRSFLLPFRPGDKLLLFSDGLSECIGPDGMVLGEERIMYIVRTYGLQPARSMVKHLIELGYDFSKNGFSDDLSLLCIEAKTPVQASEQTNSARLCRKAKSCRLAKKGLLEGSLTLRFNGAPDMEFERLRKRVEAALHLPCLDVETRSNVLLACHEAAGNIAEHALGGRPGRCRVEWRLAPGLASFEFFYEGDDYDWLCRPSSPVEDFAARGYGLSIIHEVMDSVLLCQGFHRQKVLVLCRRLVCRTT